MCVSKYDLCLKPFSKQVLATSHIFGSTTVEVKRAIPKNEIGGAGQGAGASKMGAGGMGYGGGQGYGGGGRMQPGWGSDVFSHSVMLFTCVILLFSISFSLFAVNS